MVTIVVVVLSSGVLSYCSASFSYAGLTTNVKRIRVSMLKGAGSSNINKLFSKRRFCSIFVRQYHNDSPLIFSK